MLGRVGFFFELIPKAACWFSIAILSSCEIMIYKFLISIEFFLIFFINFEVGRGTRYEVSKYIFL